MQLAPEPEPGVEERSPLAALRLRRGLAAEEAARRASLTEDQVRWLEDGRVYRFASADAALVALLLYATGLGIDHREARELAGLPVGPTSTAHDPRRRLAGLAATALLLAALVGAFVVRSGHHPRSAAAAVTAAGRKLPPAWQVYVDVLNGSGDINHTRRVASRIEALGYRIEHVARANRFDYPQTAVYFEPGGARIAARLAAQLGVPTKPLPGGANARRLVVIVGPARGPDG